MQRNIALFLIKVRHVVDCCSCATRHLVSAQQWHFGLVRRL